MQKWLRVLVLVVFGAALLAGCANPAYPLYGAWRSTDQSGLTLEFKQDGHVLETNQGLTQEALFELAGDNLTTLVIKPNKESADAQATQLGYLVEGDTLTLAVTGQAQPLTFKRLK